MSPVHLRNLGFRRNQPKDREGLSRARRPGRGNHGHSGGWQDTEVEVIAKGWNPTRKSRLLEVRSNRIRMDQATIQAIEEHLTKKGHTQIPSGSRGASQISSPLVSHHLETNRSVGKIHHSSQSQEFSRRRQGYKGKNKTTFSQRKRESDITGLLLDLIQHLKDMLAYCRHK
ncbi:hypothetical protein O181_007911 [Austropuccinia psidii MF-1]|uniref:Uncharacterized protein n=1 Tax=Austropuccinia psidii MF-1 TaxID=1389203 RepID=A0A9Q3BLP8_9BASI|nr:hypothetical protein [Austropuccinia psidii MF-1]